MRSIMENLFDQHNLGRDRYANELQDIATNAGMLKKDFNKWQKKRLLRIIDDKDSIAESWAVASFTEGVKFGVKFMTEVFNDNDNPEN